MWSRFLIFAAAAVLTACGGSTQKKAATGDQQPVVPDMHNAENALDYEGTYMGTFPAADCPGIEVALTLKPDGSYEEINKYIDRDGTFIERGAYTVKENLLTLTPQDGGVDLFYKVEENRLRKLDADKQPVTGALADHYNLTKKQQ